MITIIETAMEIVAGLILIGIAIYKIVDTIIYLRYEHDEEDDDKDESI